MIRIKTDKEIELKVLKLWKGDENQLNRPESIEVEIFRNEASFEKIVLSKENNWSYSWVVKDDGSSWMVVERNLPANYTVTVDVRENSFSIINTLIQNESTDPEIPPQTGDTSTVLLYILLMAVSGCMLTILGIAGLKKGS